MEHRLQTKFTMPLPIGTVFDFFAEIMIQRRKGKFDLGKIRQLVKDQGDDPLIKAYLPSLITGAPQPEPDEDEDGLFTA